MWVRDDNVDDSVDCSPVAMLAGNKLCSTVQHDMCHRQIFVGINDAQNLQAAEIILFSLNYIFPKTILGSGF